MINNRPSISPISVKAKLIKDIAFKAEYESIWDGIIKNQRSTETRDLK